MMYESKLAVALKSAGKVLREFQDSVYVPFGSEYSIFVKNMNSVRALVSVSVDGVDVGDGTKFVVDANDSIDIERFIKNGNFNEGNRLKFIERIGAVEDHRGIGIEDGLVRVEFNFEKPAPVYTVYPSYPRRRRWDDGPTWFTTHTTIGSSGVIGQSTFTASNSADDGVKSFASSGDGLTGDGLIDQMNVNYASTNIPTVPENDAGITVAGSLSDQQFRTTSWFPTEAETHVIVLKILGQTSHCVRVNEPVTVTMKSKCGTCGRVNKATSKFCTECGTALQIV